MMSAQVSHPIESNLSCEHTAVQLLLRPLFHSFHTNNARLQAIFSTSSHCYSRFRAPPQALLSAGVYEAKQHPKYLASLIASGGFCVMLVQRLLLFEGECAMWRPQNLTACILPQPHSFDLRFRSQVLNTHMQACKFFLTHPFPSSAVEHGRSAWCRLDLHRFRTRERQQAARSRRMRVV